MASRHAPPVQRVPSRKKFKTFKAKKLQFTMARKEFAAYQFLCRQAEAKEWFESALGDDLGGDFWTGIRDGTVLCRLANRIKKDSVPQKIHEGEAAKNPFRAMENILFFLQAAYSLGVPKGALFSPLDLFEKKNFVKVVYGLHALAKVAAEKHKFRPTIHEATGNLVFSSEEMKEAERHLAEEGAPDMATFTAGLKGGALADVIEQQEEEEEDVVEEEGSGLQTAPKMLPVVLSWGHGGLDVSVTGSFHDWERTVPLRRIGPEQSVMVYLEPGTHEYRFLVDGEWKHDPTKPTVTTSTGDVHNVIEVTQKMIDDWNNGRVLDLRPRIGKGCGGEGEDADPSIPPRSLFACGGGEYGRLGGGTDKSCPIPALVQYLERHIVKAVATGGSHSLALTDKGEVYAWGSNSYGQLSNPESGNHMRPWLVEDLLGRPVVQIDCGFHSSAAVTGRGELFVWGWDEQGRVGMGDHLEEVQPQCVEELSQHKIVSVSCGWSHKLAVTDHGQVYAWGWNNEGQIGCGDDADHPNPVLVQGELKNHKVTQVSAGYGHSAALTDSGELYTWGWGAFGQLGHESVGSVPAPKLVIDLRGKNIKKIASGYFHMLAVTKEGRAYTWGKGACGELGLGSGITYSQTPKLVKHLQDEVVLNVAAGHWHSIFLTEKGKLFGCGGNDSHALGLEETAPQVFLPTQVDDLSMKHIITVACGDEHTIAIDDYGDVFSFGRSSSGQIGHSEYCSSAPGAVVRALHRKPIYEIACGWSHNAILTRTGEVFTWGRNDSWQLGHGDTLPYRQPCLVQALILHRVSHIACGAEHTIALTDNGEVYTWGRSECGQLGHGDTKSQPTPRKVEALEGMHIVQVVCGYFHTVVLTAAGEIYTWGLGEYGQLGLGSTSNVTTLSPVKALKGIRILQIAAGFTHTVAVSDTGKVFTWGGSWVQGKKQGGTSEDLDQLDPEIVEALKEYRVLQVAAGAFHTLALTDGGEVLSWGRGDKGQLGHGDVEEIGAPRKIKSLEGIKVTQVACGHWHSVFLCDTNDLYTCGSNVTGQLGHGDTKELMTPKKLHGSLTNRQVLQVMCGEETTLFLTV